MTEEQKDKNDKIDVKVTYFYLYIILDNGRRYFHLKNSRLLYRYRLLYMKNIRKYLSKNIE